MSALPYALPQTAGDGIRTRKIHLHSRGDPFTIRVLQHVIIKDLNFFIISLINNMDQNQINITVAEFMRYLQDLKIEERLKKLENNQKKIIEILKKINL